MDTIRIFNFFRKVSGPILIGHVARRRTEILSETWDPPIVMAGGGGPVSHQVRPSASADPCLSSLAPDRSTRLVIAASPWSDPGERTYTLSSYAPGAVLRRIIGPYILCFLGGTIS